jgi:hypothetical protein
MTDLTVNFIAREPDDSLWRMVLVEEGPWDPQEIESHLRRVQQRLYDCIDVALDGEFWRLYPSSYGKPLRVQLDGYGLPEAEVREFFARFSTRALAAPEYAAALQANPYVSSIAFDLNLSSAAA